MPRLVRKRPLYERIMATINPMDFLLWLSEELETREWESKVAGAQLGLAINFVFLLARANSGSGPSRDDVFSDAGSSGWVSFLMPPLIWILAAFSFANAAYAVLRTRKYRLFEANVETEPATRSARRVRVQSSPASSSPLRFIADVVCAETAESRAHPDKTKDVWELAVWDPLPICLQLFCLFGPGHVLIYLLLLPLAPLDPRPSVTVFNTLAMQVTLSGLLLLLSARFSQQAKDSAIIQKEVMHEYDVKFVHPRVHPVVRDVGTQFSHEQPPACQEFVQVGTPTTQIRRSFHTNPNSNYAPYTHMPYLETPSHQSNVTTPQMFTPSTAGRQSPVGAPAASQHHSGVRKSLPAGYIPASASSPHVSPSAGALGHYGGNMGIYTHAKSPLKKTTSMNDITSPERTQSPRNSREMAAHEQQGWRRTKSPSRPLEMRHSVGAVLNGTGADNRSSSIPSNRRQQPLGRDYTRRW